MRPAESAVLSSATERKALVVTGHVVTGHVVSGFSRTFEGPPEGGRSCLWDGVLVVTSRRGLGRLTIHISFQPLIERASYSALSGSAGFAASSTRTRLLAGLCSVVVEGVLLSALPATVL